MDLLKMFQNEYFVTKIEIYRKECTSSNARIQAQLQSIYKTFATTEIQLKRHRVARFEIDQFSEFIPEVGPSLRMAGRADRSTDCRSLTSP